MTSRIRRARAALGGAGRDYNSMMAPSAERMQDALVRLIGSDGAGNDTLRNKVSRMAMSEDALMLLKAMPAAGAAAVGGSALATAGDLVTGDESMNRGMDLLGMGAGGAAAYGINRGVNGLGGTTKAGMALRLAAGMGLGKIGSDATQGVFGGMV
jgi:hypothetical protein